MTEIKRNISDRVYVFKMEAAKALVYGALGAIVLFALVPAKANVVWTLLHQDLQTEVVKTYENYGAQGLSKGLAYPVSLDKEALEE